jgi:hypothetical protein
MPAAASAASEPGAGCVPGRQYRVVYRTMESANGATKDRNNDPRHVHARVSSRARARTAFAHTSTAAWEQGGRGTGDGGWDGGRR